MLKQEWGGGLQNGAPGGGGSECDETRAAGEGIRRGERARCDRVGLGVRVQGTEDSDVVTSDIVSHNVLVKWFWKVNSPQKVSTLLI